MSGGRILLDDVPVDHGHKGPDDKHSVNDILKGLQEKKEEQLKLAPEKDEDVRKVLQMLEEPQYLENENELQRRERLAILLFANRDYLKKYHNIKSSILTNQDDSADEDLSNTESEDDEGEFYTPASDKLQQVRRDIIRYSIKKARERIQIQRQNAKTIKIGEEITKRRKIANSLKNFELSGTQILSTRPISKIAISPFGDSFAAGSWCGDLSIVNSQTLEKIVSVDDDTRGKIGGLDWNSEGSLISGAEDALIKLYQYDVTDNSLKEQSSFKGHEGRVANVKFHPTGSYFASASFDTTWRLWDVNTGIELQLQEGHAKEVYSVSFQCDGSLLCSGSFDKTSIVWDIRSGKSIMKLGGHSKPIYAVDWSPDGYHLATGGGDGLINIWDIRQSNSASEILAHNSIISDLKFSGSDEKCLYSSGYDKIINIYSTDNWFKISKLEGHTDKILAFDVPQDNKYIISGGWDRSIKLWENSS